MTACAVPLCPPDWEARWGQARRKPRPCMGRTATGYTSVFVLTSCLLAITQPQHTAARPVQRTRQNQHRRGCRRQGGERAVCCSYHCWCAAERATAAIRTGSLPPASTSAAWSHPHARGRGGAPSAATCATTVARAPSRGKAAVRCTCHATYVRWRIPCAARAFRAVPRVDPPICRWSNATVPSACTPIFAGAPLAHQQPTQAVAAAP